MDNGQIFKMNGEQQKKPPALVHLPGTLGFSAVYPDSINLVSDFVFKKYKTDDQDCLTRDGVRQMMKDMYRSFNMNFQPTERDIDQYIRMLDIEKNGLLNEKNMTRLTRKHVAVSKYDIDKKYLKSDSSNYISTSSSASIKQESVSSFSQTQVINLQPLQPLQTSKNFNNTENMGPTLPSPTPNQPCFKRRSQRKLQPSCSGGLGERKNQGRRSNSLHGIRFQ
jgi:hypothetical protein